MIFIGRILGILSCLTAVYGFWAGDLESKITWPDDPEVRWKDDTKYPVNQADFALIIKGMENLGTILAGRTEFPYLVDIRLEGRDQEDWAVGNLLSHKTVLTTCRWAVFCLRITRQIQVDWGTDDLKNIRNRNNVPELSVYYTPMYFAKELSDTVPNFWDKKVSSTKQGHRSVRFISTHPRCTTYPADPINYDFSVLVLTREIPPILPYVGFMPIRLERTHLLITDFDLSRHEGQHIVCYVASVGRNYKNWKNHIAVDYKVKYRVYYEDWAKCTFHYEKYRCPSSETDLPSKPGANRTYHHCPGGVIDTPITKDRFSAGYDNLMCFNSRKAIGAVCDHDNGAPLVCDGKVFGLVSRGVHINWCNSVLPVPFVVTKITPASDYYFNLARNPYSFNLQISPGDISGLSSAETVKPLAISIMLPAIFSFVFIKF